VVKKVGLPLLLLRSELFSIDLLNHQETLPHLSKDQRLTMTPSKQGTVFVFIGGLFLLSTLTSQAKEQVTLTKTRMAAWSKSTSIEANSFTDIVKLPSNFFSSVSPTQWYSREAVWNPKPFDANKLSIYSVWP
jgi:hypothetical protein